MLGIFTVLFSFLSKLPGAVGKYFEKKQELEQIKLETQKQIALAQQQMASDMAKAESETAIARLAVTSSYFKYFTFCMWFGPFVSGVFFPQFADTIFKNLGQMPDWYVQSCVMIMFAIWGIQVAAPVVANIFSGLNNYLGERRTYKLESKRIDRTAVFDSLKKAQGALSQRTVDEVNKALDSGENSK